MCKDTLLAEPEVRAGGGCSNPLGWRPASYRAARPSSGASTCLLVVAEEGLVLAACQAKVCDAHAAVGAQQHVLRPGEGRGRPASCRSYFSMHAQSQNSVLLQLRQLRVKEAIPVS